jgi:hypothetical protein
MGGVVRHAGVVASKMSSKWMKKSPLPLATIIKLDKVTL